MKSHVIDVPLTSFHSKLLSSTGSIALTGTNINFKQAEHSYNSKKRKSCREYAETRRTIEPTEKASSERIYHNRHIEKTIR